MSEYLSKETLSAEGWYWVADKTESGAKWGIMYLGREESLEGEDYDWMLGPNEDELYEDVQDYHVLIGPIPVPTAPIPFERVTRTVQLPAPALTLATPAAKPVVPALKKVVKLDPFSGGGSSLD